MNTNNNLDKPFACLNGEYKPLDEMYVSAMDRGFLYGDGCYEVIPVYNKKPFQLVEHIERLYANIDKIQIVIEQHPDEIIQMLKHLISMTNMQYEYLYLQITRGTYPKREHIFPVNPKPTVFAYTFPFLPKDPASLCGGLKAITQEDYRWERCDIKSISLLANVLLRQKANQEGAEEVILLKDGFVTEGSISNVFIVKNGLVMTPPLSNSILPGITRAKVIELIHENAISFEELPISENDLRDADEIWICSSTREVVPISNLDGISLDGPLYNRVWEKIIKVYQEARS